MIRSNIRTLTFWLLGLLPIQFCLGQQPATKPNIIFIIADDLGYRNLGCHSSKSVQTPHLDRMCAEGIKFPCFITTQRTSRAGWRIRIPQAAPNRNHS